MTIEKDVVDRRVQEIRIFAEELKRLSAISKEAFLENAERQYAVMHVLQLAIEACLSVGNHIVSRRRLGIPENYQDIFQLLEKGKILPPAFAKEMMKMARFRNRLVHLYWQTDLEQLYEIVTTKLDDFEEYARLIQAAAD
jgi:uncharacterized protein YutE (UPF0331/DUF86 family)